MSKLNEGLNKAKDLAKDTADKVNKNEKFSEIKNQINNNQLVDSAKTATTDAVKKVEKSKYSKFIKIGMVALAIIVVISVFSALFGNSREKQAVKSYKEYVFSQSYAFTGELFEDASRDFDVSVKCVDSDKKKNLYILDVVLKWNECPLGTGTVEHRTTKEIVVIELKTDGLETIQRYAYFDDRKFVLSKMKEYIK